MLGLIRIPTLRRPKSELSGGEQGFGLMKSPDFVSIIVTLLPTAPFGRSLLYRLRQASSFSAASEGVEPVPTPAFRPEASTQGFGEGIVR